MSSRIVGWMDWVSARWAALTPPTLEAYAFHELDSDEVKDGELADRGFLFDFPQRGEPEQINDDVSTAIPWTIDVAVYRSKSSLDRRDFVDAVTNEVNLLMRSIEKASESEYPAGVLEIATGECVVAVDEDGDAFATLSFRVLCSEDD